MERKYYLVKPEGKSMEAIMEWQKLSKEASKASYDLAKEYGADQVWQSRESILGFHFKTHPGRWWKEVTDHDDIYCPDRRSTAGKTIAKRMESIRLPGNETFANIIGGGHFIVRGNQWGRIGFEIFGDKYVISLPIGDPEEKDSSFVPPDTTPLKLSEYYALKGE